MARVLENAADSDGCRSALRSCDWRDAGRLWSSSRSQRCSGRVPAVRGRAVALRVEPLSKAHRLAPDGQPSLTRARRHRPRSLARRVSPACGPWGPCRCARQCSDQGCAFIARLNSQVRPAARAVRRQRPVPVLGDRGPWFLRAARERGPLDELTGVPLTPPLRFVRCTPARSSPRSPATPDARAAEALLCSHPLDRRVSRCAWCHVGRRAAAARDLAVGFAVLRRPLWWQRVRQSSHRAPTSCAPVESQGGLVGGSSRHWPVRARALTPRKLDGVVATLVAPASRAAEIA